MRDELVAGVQTCALAISARSATFAWASVRSRSGHGQPADPALAAGGAPPRVSPARVAPGRLLPGPALRAAGGPRFRPGGDLPAPRRGRPPHPPAPAPPRAPPP